MSPPLEARLKDLLDETRLVMLGAQLLMGIQYQAAFAPAFASLALVWRVLDGVALLLILAAVALLLATPAFHQIVEGGHATRWVLERASRGLCWALGPLAVAIGMDLAIALAGATGPWVAAGAGAALVALTIAAWYAVPMAAADRRPREDGVEDKTQSLESRITQALTELRVILPGAQALFGFQFMAILTQQFQTITPVSRLVHLVALGLVAIAVVMLIAPAAYHRIAARGRAEEGVLRYTIAMMLPAVGLLMLGLVGDCYVTVRLITGSEPLAVGVALIAMAGLAMLLYGLPLLARHRRAAGRR